MRRVIAGVKRLPRGVRYTLAVVLLALFVAGNWLGISALRIYRANLSALRTDLAPWETVSRGERALVIAPHCDDETLACGGAIGKLVKAGARVKVVLVTNGDGYYELMRKLRLAGPKNYIAFGVKRQKETLAAMRMLGVPESDVIFLGYPDRGTAAMWIGHWSEKEPYKSRYTKCSRSPYANSYRPNASFCGRNLLEDLESIMRDYRPTTVFYPHPSDQHSDHWAVHCFVTQALYETGLLGRVRAGLYIVHRGDWPIPQGLHPTLRLRPPAYLTNIGTRWYESPLTKEQVALKLKAIHSYKSQIPFLGDFLRSFDRTNELFGDLEPTDVCRMDASPNESDDQTWERVAPCILDPVGDSLRVDMGRGGDIHFVRCYYDDKSLHVCIELDHPHSRRMNYGIQVCGLPDADAGRVRASITSRGRVYGEASAERAGRTIEFIVALSQLGDWDALMLCADSSVEKMKVDRTAWRLLYRDAAAKRPRTQASAQSLQAHRPQASPARKPL